MFFSEDLYNLILILGCLILFIVINHFINKIYNRYDKVECSLNSSGEELAKQYALSKGIKNLEIIPNTNLPEFDMYSLKRNSLILNTRCYFSKSISANLQTIELMAFHHLYLKHHKWYKFSLSFDVINTFIGVAGWGILIIGILMQSIAFWWLGFGLIIVNFVYILISFRYVKIRYDVAYQYLLKKVNNDEAAIIKKIIHYDLINYLAKSLLAIVRIFGLFLPANQKKNSLNKYK